LLEANGHLRTLWRRLPNTAETLPPLCPSTLSDLVKSLP
jgi:hypothetical protein